MSNSTSNVRISWGTPVLLVQSLFIVAVNTIALIVFFRKEFLVKKSNYLLMSLCASDLLVGVSLFIQNLDRLNRELYRTMFKVNLAETTNSMVAVCIYLSVLTIAGMATERAFAVFVPFRQRSLNRRHYIIAITIIWVLAISIELPVILYKLNSIQMGRSKLNALENYLRVVFVSLAILTMAICYLAILLKRRFSQPVQGNEARIARDNARLTRTVVTVTILSLTCFIPIGCYFIYEASCIKCQYTSNMVQDLFLIFAYNNSFLNVVVYAYRMADFRQILREMFCKRLHTNPSRFLNIYGEPRINRNKNKCSTRSVKILDIAILDEGPENRKQKDDITMHSMTTVTGVENIGHANDATNVREI